MHEAASNRERGVVTVISIYALVFFDKKPHQHLDVNIVKLSHRDGWWEPTFESLVKPYNNK